MMDSTVQSVLLWSLSVVALVGAGVVVFSRDILRLALGLGAFLVAGAGVFAWLGFGFLALAQLFVYVGGVLVLVLFAMMLVHRSTPGRPDVDSRHDPLAAVASVGVAGFLFALLRPMVLAPEGAADTSADVGAVLLGGMMPQFIMAGVLLLAALVAVVAVSGGDRS